MTFPTATLITCAFNYNDVVAINKVLQTMQSQEASDVAMKPIYMENAYTTSDGIRIGYRIENGSAAKYWVQFNISNQPVFPKDEYFNMFAEAQRMIEEMKK